MSDQRAVIVGGGVIGLCTAYRLARRGVEVVVLDDTGLDTSASTGNAGIIAFGHPPLPRPGLVVKTLKWMLDPASPLYVPIRVDPALIRWMWQFRAACRAEVFNRSLRLLAELGHAASEEWDRLLAEEPFDCHAVRGGWLEVFRTEGARAHGREDAELLRSTGYEVDELSREAVRAAEPAFHESIIGGLRFHDGIAMHPGRFLVQLAEHVEAHGGTVHRNTRVARLRVDVDRVRSVDTDDGRRFEAGTVVLAAGSWTAALAEPLGLRLPMQPGKGYHVSIPPIDPPLTTAAVLADRHIAVTPMGDSIRLAGTVELSGMNLRQHPRRVAMLTEGAAEYLPAVADVKASEGWCGLRPCTADGLPVLGRMRDLENVFIGTGHAKMGLTLGPISGRLLAELIVDGRPSLDIEAFSPTRFH